MFTVFRVPATGEYQRNPVRDDWADFVSRPLVEMRRIMDSFVPLTDTVTAGFSPQMDISEDDKAFHVNMEIPGVEEKEIDITLKGDTLTIRGEKKEESKSNKGEDCCTERIYGTFSRMITLPADVKGDKVTAVYDKGVLHITLPKLGEGKGTKKIPIRGSDKAAR